MFFQLHQMLVKARDNNYAVGAFNVYNLEGVRAVIKAAEACHSPVIIQLLPRALAVGGTPFVQLCMTAARDSRVPVAVHLDHSPLRKDILSALGAGVSSVMADGSALSFEENIRFTRDIVQLAGEYHAQVEGELGRMIGTEDSFTVSGDHGKLTDPDQARQFVNETGVSVLAVCIGNVHGQYTSPPDLDFDRLKQIRDRVDVPLVLHGTSGLPDYMITKAMALGVCKFNVNTEIRTAYVNEMARCFDGGNMPELVDVMENSIEAMTGLIKDKIRLFGSKGSFKDNFP